MSITCPGAAPLFDVAAGYHPFGDCRYVHAVPVCWLDVDVQEWRPSNSVKGDRWLASARWSANSPTQNTFGLSPPPISFSRFPSGPYPDRSPVAPPETRIRRRSPR